MMGDKILKIYGDNIMLVDEVYVATSALWMLITDILFLKLHTF